MIDRLEAIARRYEHKGGRPPLWGTPQDLVSLFASPTRGGRPAKPGDAETTE